MSRLDLSLTDQELEEYLRDRRTARVASVSDGGIPHVIPLWFVWHDGALFLNTTLGNVTVENVAETGRASAVIDDGESYDTLRGVVLSGAVARADDDGRIPDVERAWSDKYLGGSEVPYRKWRNRAWFRFDPARVASWDFRKIPEARARREAEGRRRAEGPASQDPERRRTGADAAREG